MNGTSGRDDRQLQYFLSYMKHIITHGERIIILYNQIRAVSGRAA